MKQQPLTDWLVNELNTKYQVPSTLAQVLLSADQILPLLDGLDEVAPTARTACIEAINSYRREHGLLPSVVCSRQTDYLAQTGRLLVRSAVAVQPLTQEQVDAYLAQGGEPLWALRVALHQDATLQELTATPLMLSILTLTYHSKPVEELLRGTSMQERQRQIFEQYVGRMLTRRGLLKAGTPQQVVQWLTSLARRMSERNQTVFYLEEMQLDWLPSRQQLQYWWSLKLLLGLLAGLIVGLPTGITAGLQTGLLNGIAEGLLAGFLGAAVIGFLAGLICERKRKIQPAEAIIWSWTKAQNWLLSGLVSGLSGALTIGSLLMGLEGASIIGLYMGLLIGPIFWLLTTLLKRLVNSQGGRRRTNAITWSWGKAWSGLFVGLCAATIALIVIPPIPPFPPPAPPLSEVITWHINFLSILLPVSAILWLLIGLLMGLSVNQLTDRVHFSPNEGIQRSGRNGLIAGVITGLLTGGLSTNLMIGLVVGLIVGLMIGLDAFVRHFILRFWLWRMNRLPWNVVAFLDEAASCILLQKVGGGYLFVHRLLWEYFASLKATQSQDVAKASQQQTVAVP